MTKVGSVRRVPVGEFKAKCLRMIADVRETGEVVITKRGIPVARLLPFDQANDAPLKGLIVSQGDLVSPIEGIAWDVAL